MLLQSAQIKELMTQEAIDWDNRYKSADTPWDSGEPSRELLRVLRERWIGPCRALELGCGTGTNALILARRGFKMTAVDLSPIALGHAKAKARKARLKVKFLEGDALHLPKLGAPFPFVFDRGLYHHLRNVDLKRFRRALARVTRPGSFYLTLAGNGNEKDPEGGGPPRVHAHEICLELGPDFDLVQLREFRFDGVRVQGQEIHPLAWSALLRRKERK